MANSSTRRSRPVRTIVVLMVLTVVVPFAALFAGTLMTPKSEDNPGGASLTPGLALDLEGGTQVILHPATTDGSQLKEDTISEAINVIRQRVDSSGVSEAEITSQGGENIVVGIPGEVSQETIDLVAQAAQMRFRPVLTYDVGSPLPEPTEEPSVAPSEEPTADPSASPDSSPNGKSRGSAVTAPSEDPSAEPTAEPSPESGGAPAQATDPSDLAQITPEIQKQFQELDCSKPENVAGGGGDDPKAVLVTCSQDGSTKWILGPVEVEGVDLTTASSGLKTGANGVVTNEWAVNLEFNSAGTTAFRQTTERLQSLESPRNQFAIVLDGLVVSAPSLSPGTIITDGRAEISGSFNRESAATLANQLSFGSLPIAFEVQSQEQISATLGSEQLRNGLIAGLIGLALVVVYSLFQYRTLGLLTVASLVIAGLITYASIALLSWGIGYRLSLAGVAGLIVAIGFTADSFIVYFERIRDELRDGRSLAYAVERGWHRARRTVLAAKSVNLISAVILYYLAVGGVQGFAFTLGLTTIIDVAVVFWFTHPVMELISKVPFFRDGHRWSGLSPERLRTSGPRYAGAGRITSPVPVPAQEEPEMALATAGTSAGSTAVGRETRPKSQPATGMPTGPATGAPAGAHRMTIAERRAAERKAAAAGQRPVDPDTAGIDADRSKTEESR